MGMPDIFVEHKRGEKTQRFLRVKPKRSLFLIGSSKEVIYESAAKVLRVATRHFVTVLRTGMFVISAEPSH